MQKDSTLSLTRTKAVNFSCSSLNPRTKVTRYGAEIQVAWDSSELSITFGYAACRGIP